MNCGCENSKSMGSCCKGVETATALAKRSASSSKAGTGTGRKG